MFEAKEAETTRQFADFKSEAPAKVLGKESKEKPGEAVVICGFPGVGKTSLFKESGELQILDSDSTNFSWADSEKTQRHPDWPQNYLDHIQTSRGHADIILVSSHDVVRKALEDAGTQFTLVYPSLEMKEEYIQRYVDRGSSEQFIVLLKANYETWIQELMSQKNCTHVVLKSGQYLSDVIQNVL